MKRFISLGLVLIAILSMTVSAAADSKTVLSDTSVMVYGPLNNYAAVGNAAWGSPHAAVPTWDDPWQALDSATWISNSEFIEGNISGDTWRWFRRTVDLCQYAYDISGTISANSDNAEEVYVNGSLIGSEGTVQGDADGLFWWQTSMDYNFNAAGDTLTFDFIVRNYSGSGDPKSNPTGLIFSASVNYSCPVEVTIDIKPGSFPSCFNNDGNGVIPVAIFGSATFDVNKVAVSTVQLEGLPVVLRSNGKYMAAYEDLNGDGYLDLVVKFMDADGVFDSGETTATLMGNLKDGTHFFGVGDICVRGSGR